MSTGRVIPIATASAPRETRSTCPYCGVGCGVIIESSAEQITGVRGDPEHPANFGRLCTKGSTLHLSATAAVTQQARLLQPMQRRQRGQALRAVGWDAALQLASGQGSGKERMESLQSALKCGTNCGSCVPELQRMVRATLPS